MVTSDVAHSRHSTHSIGDEKWRDTGLLPLLITLNVKVEDAYEEMLKIIPTSYVEPYEIPPTENPISDDNDDDKDKCF